MALRDHQMTIHFLKYFLIKVRFKNSLMEWILSLCTGSSEIATKSVCTNESDGLENDDQSQIYKIFYFMAIFDDNLQVGSPPTQSINYKYQYLTSLFYLQNFKYHQMPMFTTPSTLNMILTLYSDHEVIFQRTRRRRQSSSRGQLLVAKGTQVRRAGSS